MASSSWFSPIECLSRKFQRGNYITAGRGQIRSSLDPFTEQDIAMSQRWTLCRQTQNAARVRLVCFPYAGGHAGTYRSWQQLLPDWIELHVVQLPGRMPRFAEPALTSIPATAAACCPELLQIAEQGPYAFFGHSMGASIAFEAARLLSRHGHEPLRLFVSARQAPQLPWVKAPLGGLDDAELTAALRVLGGTPEAVLASRELMALLRPTLRADFTAIESYRWDGQGPLTCPLSLLGGRTDPRVSATELEGWRVASTGPVQMTMFSGGHFYLEEAAGELAALITAELLDA